MLSQRVSRARQIANANLVKQMSERAWLVPGSEGKQYLVTRRKGTNQFKCVLDCGGYGQQDCRGNENGLCYHILTAILAGAKAKGYKAAICETLEDAIILKNLGGQVYRVTSAQSGKAIWMVIKANG